MNDIRGPVSRDPSPQVIARWEKKIAGRVAQQERRLIERAMRLFYGANTRRCYKCG